MPCALIDLELGGVLWLGGAWFCKCCFYPISLGLKTRYRYGMQAFNIVPFKYLFIFLQKVEQQKQHWYTGSHHIWLQWLRTGKVKARVHEFHLLLPRGWQERQVLESSTCCFPRCISRELERRKSSLALIGTLIWHASTANGGLTWFTIMLFT